MTSSPPVLVSVDGAVGWLTLNRPEAFNAITIELARALAEGVTSLSRSVDVIVVRGADGNFSAGGDFRELSELVAQGPEAVAELFEAFGDACDRIAQAPVPVIAAVGGVAMAGGFELMLASDIAIVADDARLADIHANFGQVPGGGSTQRLARVVGQQRALALILTGGRLSPSDAVDWGIAHRAVPGGELYAEAQSLAESLAGRSRLAATRIKRLVRRGLDLPLAEGLALERRTVVEYLDSDAGQASLASFSTERNTP